mgnify:CR=1 FL=1
MIEIVVVVVVVVEAAVTTGLIRAKESVVETPNYRAKKEPKVKLIQYSVASVAMAMYPDHSQPINRN